VSLRQAALIVVQIYFGAGWIFDYHILFNNHSFEPKYDYLPNWAVLDINSRILGEQRADTEV
jgi:hypothetical protein